MLVKEWELSVEGKEKNTFQLGFLIAKSILYGEIQWKNLVTPLLDETPQSLKSYLMNQST